MRPRALPRPTGFARFEPAPPWEGQAAFTALPADETITSRAALAVKIDNAVGGPPHWNLADADLVFEENVEGITRFIAVYQTNMPDRIGPVRSARTSDIDILASLNRPILAWSGGNAGVTLAVRGAHTYGWLSNLSAQSSGCFYRSGTRGAPHNLLLDPACARASATLAGPARPVFLHDGGGDVPGERDERFTVHMDGIDVTWAWDAESQRYLRRQRGGWHVDVDGDQVGAENVVVLHVDYRRSAGGLAVAGGGDRRLWSGSVAPRRSRHHRHVVARRPVLPVHARRRRRTAVDAGARHDVRRARPLSRDDDPSRSRAAELLLGDVQRLLVRIAALLPCGVEGRVSGVAHRADHVGVVVDHHGHLTPTRELLQQLELHRRRRTAIALGAHDQPVTADALLRQPALGVGSQPVRTPGEEDDLVVGLQRLDQRDPLGMSRVVDGGGEEAVPIARAAFDEVQAVAHVGQYAVDVDERQRPLGRIAVPVVVVHDRASVGDAYRAGDASDQNSIR